ncbi:MFS transporter [Hydrocarboniphaga sp.]|uniref:MFS transporter n=1 Tax=Hydrocarboniphaga sp. TaxID=2033016 RepID=UPI003D0B6E23
MKQDTVLGRGLLFAFALPAIMLGFTHAPESSVQGIYAKHAGLSLSAIASAMLLSRIFDAITYPLIGQLSDYTYRKTGSRKPWIAAGTLVTVLGLWFLYRPPANVSITYYTVWTIVTYVGWKLTEIPYGAWSYGLSGDYAQRARVQVWRSIAMVVGGMVFFAVPQLSKALGLTASSEMNLQTLSFAAIAIAVCVPLINAYALARVPNGDAPLPSQNPLALGDWRGLVRAITRNRAMLHLLSAFVPVAFICSMAVAVNYLFIDSYLHLSEQLPTIMLVATPFALLGLPFWGWIFMKFERHRVWAVSLVLSALAYSTIGFAPIGTDGLWLVAAANAITNFCLMATAIAVPSMMGDVVDDERLRSGEDRGGLYSAVSAFTGKSMAGVAGAAGLYLLDVLGFSASATEQTAQGAFAIKLIAAWLPTVGMACGAALIWRFPIDRARQQATRQALQARDGAESSPPL